MRRPVHVVIVVIAVAALLGACSSSSSKSSGTTTTTRAPAGPRGAPTSSAELEARIVTKVPSPFVVQPPAAYDTGPSDLAKAIRDYGRPNAAKILRAENFVRGYQRIWIGPDHAQIIVFVDQFASSTGGRQDFATTTRDFETKPPLGVHKFLIPGLSRAQAVGAAGTAKDGAAAFVFFTTGVFSVEINCNGPSIEGLQARAIAITKVQLRRL